MDAELGSFLWGTIAIDVLLAAALVLTLTRGPVPVEPGTRRRLTGLFVLAVAVQGVHFAEEWATGFHQRFPVLLGLPPWSVELWAGFNLAWFGIWGVSLAGLHLGWRPVLVPVWFLALACGLNCAAHPLLALAAGGYFPGLWSSPICGLVGVPLLARLARATRPG